MLTSATANLADYTRLDLLQSELKIKLLEGEGVTCPATPLMTGTKRKGIV